MSFMNFINELFSASGKISSKRVIGTFTLLIVMSCVVFLTIKEGGTRTVEELLTTAMFLAAALLGISNITSIWKSGNISYEENNKKIKKTTKTTKTDAIED